MPGRAPASRARYDRIASFYDALLRGASLGQFTRLHRAVADAIDAPPGARVFDVGCGTGLLLPHLLRRLGPTGSVVGIDAADAMLERARARAAREGWSNVCFERSDAREFSPAERAHAVVFCLSLSTIPEPRRCLSRSFSWLEPGGQLVVLDSFLEPGRRLTGLLIRLKSPLVGADPRAISVDEIVAGLDAPRRRPFLGGVYTLVAGRKRADPQGLDSTITGIRRPVARRW